MKTQVCIIGAGPAGLLLGHLLRAEGIECVVLERQSPDYVLGRIRAGVLERITVSLMERLGLDARLKAEGVPHDGFNLADGERLIRIDIAELTGQHVTVYGQTELTRDLMEASAERGLEVIYHAGEVALHDLESDSPSVTFTYDGAERRIEARFVVGCDGFHGPSRQAVLSQGTEFEREYPFGWLGILADVPPCHDELSYYIDVPLTDRVEDWPDERLWDELAIRLPPEAAAHIVRGPALEKSIAPLRSYVFAPMRHGSLLLCGDAAHIVPPTGAKGLNLAASDVHYAAEAMVSFFKKRDPRAIASYADKALARVWKAERFSWSLTRLMHRFPEDGPFERAMQVAELDYIASSRAAQTAIAENYVGLPV
jgi:p-hydroxybenzoate 3-monooxygenase